MAQHQSKGGGGLGTVVGFIAGVGVGLLFAKPETREWLTDLLRMGRERGGKLAEKAGEELEQAKETMTSEGGKEPFYESGKYT